VSAAIVPGHVPAVPALGRKVAAEAVGTCLLVAAVVGSGIAAVRLSPGQIGLQLLVNAVVTGAALVSLILALQPVSAAFNPIVTAIEWSFGAIPTADAAALVGAQVAGATAGAILANLMFGDSAISIATTDRGGAGVWLAEAVATAGLVIVVFGTARTGRGDRTAYAVGAYITAAYWFTSSTSFANPAVTISRMFSDSFAGIAPTSTPIFLLAQVVGGVVGYVLIRLLVPHPVTTAADLVRPEQSRSGRQ